MIIFIINISSRVIQSEFLFSTIKIQTYRQQGLALRNTAFQGAIGQYTHSLLASRSCLVIIKISSLHVGPYSYFVFLILSSYSYFCFVSYSRIHYRLNGFERFFSEMVYIVKSQTMNIFIMMISLLVRVINDFIILSLSSCERISS